MQEFGSTYFKKTVYINFDNNQRMKTLFEGDYDIGRIIMGLEIESGQDIRPEDTPLIFDEIQEAPRAMSSLKYFNENAPECAVVATSFLEAAGNENLDKKIRQGSNCSTLSCKS